VGGELSPRKTASSEIREGKLERFEHYGGDSDPPPETLTSPDALQKKRATLT